MTRKRPDSQPDIRERVRAADCYMRNAYRVDAPEEMKMAAFMAIFHPEIKGKKLKALVGDSGSK